MARTYRLKQRAERQNETRERIVEATVELHTTLGPAHTSILAIAERAGVERPTVYRHFPTTEALFTACTSHYQAQHPAPDPEAWLAIDAPEARLRKGLGELYAYYAEQEGMLWVVTRDFEDNPELQRFAEPNVRYRERAIEIMAAAWPKPHSPKLRASVGHATDFFAWRSLRRQGLSNEEAVEMMVELARAVR
jgi:AcrR family transcriptional regulator